MENNQPSFFVHPSAVVDNGAIIGEGSSIWHFTHVMSDTKMGKGCSLGQNVFIAGGVELGNNVKIQNNVSVYKGVTCEDDVFLGPSMVFTNVINPRSAVNRRSEYAATIVRQGVSIGANATIVCGVELGKYCFIGAGTVVTKDIPAYALVVGNPARQLGWVGEYGHRLDFSAGGIATCSESGQEYTLQDNLVTRTK